MKKVFVFLFVLLALSLAFIYLFIPSKIEIERTIYVKAVADVTYRYVSKQTGWQRWFRPEASRIIESDSQPASFFHDNIKYSFASQTMGPVQIKISTNGNDFSSTMIVVALKKDSTAVNWKCQIKTGNNPFKKIQHYQKSKDIASSMEYNLERLRSFLTQANNLYSINIERMIVADTILVSSRVILNHYPSTIEVYNEINKLKQYINSKGAKETNYPMLHILKIDSSRFQAMVAIPVDKKIPDRGDIVYKRMVPGNILVTKVTGGRYSIEQAFAEMETYVKDNELIPPAIPFQSLETDRLKEPDTTKWITRIYFPIL